MKNDYLGYEFSLDGYGQLKNEILEPEPDVSMRLYHMNNWVEAARESWQYHADPFLRELVDKLMQEHARYEQKIEGLTTLQLELLMLVDKAKEALNVHQAGMRRKYTAAYRAGQRDEGFLNMYRQVMKWDEEAGTFNPEDYDGLTPDDLEQQR